MGSQPLDNIYQQILAKLPPDEAGRLIRQMNPEPGPQIDPLAGVSPGSQAGTIQPTGFGDRIRDLSLLKGLGSMQEQPGESGGFGAAQELLDPASYGTAGKIFQTLAPNESNVLGAVRGLIPSSRQDLPGTVGTVAGMAMGAAAPGAQAGFAGRPTPPSFAPGQAAQMARGRVRANPAVQGQMTTNPAGALVRKGPYSRPADNVVSIEGPASGVKRAGGATARAGGYQTPTEGRMGPPGSPRRMARASETLKRKPGQAGPSTRLEEMRRPPKPKPVPAPGAAELAGPEGDTLFRGAKQAAKKELTTRMRHEQLGEGVKKMKSEQLGEGVKKMRAEQAAENPESSIDAMIERFRRAGMTAEQIQKILRNREIL